MLKKAALDLMWQNGMPLRPQPSKDRSRVYTFRAAADGSQKTVRLRTSMVPALVVNAGRPEADAPLSIEGTDYLLFAMPALVPVRAFDVAGYLIKTEDAVAAVRAGYVEWLKTHPNTSGGNTTWEIRFDQKGPDTRNDYATKWAGCRLFPITSGAVADPLAEPDPAARTNIDEPAIAVVENARAQIAAFYGVPLRAVRLTIDLNDLTTYSRQNL